MNKVVGFLKFIFYISLLLLIVITLYPGSLLGLLLYGDPGMQPNLAENPYFTPMPSHLYTYASIINHFIVYFCIYHNYYIHNPKTVEESSMRHQQRFNGWRRFL